MRPLPILLLLISGACLSAGVTVGSPQVSGCAPIGIGWSSSLHYQAVVLAEEMQGAMEISSIACNRYSPGDTVEGTFYDFAVYLAHTEQESLGSEFDENWIEGTRELVFQRDSLTLTNSPGQWVEFTLDAPYWYNGTQNLVLEFLWSSAETEDACMYSWHWDSGSIRSLNGGYADSTGTMSSLLVMLEFQGELALDVATFGGIKALLGSGEE